MNREKKSGYKPKCKINLIAYANNDCAKTTSIVLNQFICIECYTTKGVMERIPQATKLYNIKRLDCKCCKKKTEHICAGNKSLNKAILETKPEKTKEEKEAYQYIKKSYLVKK